MKFVSLLLASAAVFGGSNAFAQEAGYTPPKTSWGVPDLNGEWTNASLTGLQRDASVTKTTVTEAEARAIFPETQVAKDFLSIDVVAAAELEPG